MNRSLPPKDRETVIMMNDADDEATIITYSFKWQKHIENKFNIRTCLEARMGCVGAKAYKIPKECIKMPVPESAN